MNCLREVSSAARHQIFWFSVYPWSAHLVLFTLYFFQYNPYRVLVNQCSTNYNRLVYETEHLKDVCPDFPSGADCPVCVNTRDQLPLNYAMDGNFRLYRKKSSGKSAGPAFHKGRMFLESVSEEPEPEPTPDTEGCSNFKAGKMTTLMKKKKRLDTFGCFGSVSKDDNMRVMLVPQTYMNFFLNFWPNWLCSFSGMHSWKTISVSKHGICWEVRFEFIWTTVNYIFINFLLNCYFVFLHPAYFRFKKCN